MEMEMIVACTKTGVIGNNNTIPWHIPEDLKHFKKLTEHNILVMGRKTYESLPLLKNRKFVVITNNSEYCKDVVVANMETVLHKLNKLQKEEWDNGRKGKIFIIGGGEIYNLFFDLCSKVHLTIVNKNIAGDTYFPLYKIKEYKEPETGDYTFLTYNL